MTPSEDSAYRLVLARQYLGEAEQDLELNRWRSAVEAAQLTIESIHTQIFPPSDHEGSQDQSDPD